MPKEPLAEHSDSPLGQAARRSRDAAGVASPEGLVGGTQQSATEGELRYAWLVWGRYEGDTLPLGCYATREVALAAEDLAKAQPGADEWDDIWITPWPLETEPRVNFRMRIPNRTRS